MEIEVNFKNSYLICGATYDNFIFENCPKPFMKEAFKLLCEPTTIYPCNVIITKSDEKKVENILNECSTELQKIILARDFITALVMREVLKGIPAKKSSLHVLDLQIKAFLDGEMYKVKQYHFSAYFPSDVARYYGKFGAFEVNFFLLDTNNVYIQKAVNNFFSCRAPYCVKLFTNNKRLPSYLDEAGNLIQSPHDYMTKNVNEYILNKEKD